MAMVDDSDYSDGQQRSSTLRRLFAMRRSFGSFPDGRITAVPGTSGNGRTIARVQFQAAYI